MSGERYLKAAYRDRERVKALGAKWDGEAKRWYVPPGRDLAPFSAWLSETAGAEMPTGGSLEPVKGITLSALLAGVADAVAQARGVLWESTANTVVPAFEQATGVVIGPGIKLLVRAKPTLHPLYGLSLVVDAIDPDYTLGDLEARKREIRARLKREGWWDRNRQLPPPWDYQHVLVVAPALAAGLGDFQAEAQRLQQHGICRFDYVHSRFQGEGAAGEIRSVLLEAIASLVRASLVPAPDAVVIIRGGGAVNDLAWLNDYDLARCLCELPVPVLTGIGHERDSTVLDEVAHQSFDTPSKVIAGIEQLIVRRTTQAKAHFETIGQVARRDLVQGRQRIEQAIVQVRTRAHHAVVSANQQGRDGLDAVRQGGQRWLQAAHRSTQDHLAGIRAAAGAQLGDSRETTGSWRAQVQAEARRVAQLARERSSAGHRLVLERAASLAGTAAQAVQRDLGDVAASARLHVRRGAERSEALMREIAGQGPRKSLRRGFAIVRRPDGSPVTHVAAVDPGAAIEIELNDGKFAATTHDIRQGEPPDE